MRITVFILVILIPIVIFFNGFLKDNFSNYPYHEVKFNWATILFYLISAALTIIAEFNNRRTEPRNDNNNRRRFLLWQIGLGSFAFICAIIVFILSLKIKKEPPYFHPIQNFMKSHQVCFFPANEDIDDFIKMHNDIPASNEVIKKIYEISNENSHDIISELSEDFISHGINTNLQKLNTPESIQNEVDKMNLDIGIALVRDKNKIKYIPNEKLRVIYIARDSIIWLSELWSSESNEVEKNNAIKNFKYVLNKMKLTKILYLYKKRNINREQFKQFIDSLLTKIETEDMYYNSELCVKSMDALLKLSDITTVKKVIHYQREHINKSKQQDKESPIDWLHLGFWYFRLSKIYYNDLPYNLPNNNLSFYNSMDTLNYCLVNATKIKPSAETLFVTQFLSNWSVVQIDSIENIDKKIDYYKNYISFTIQYINEFYKSINSDNRHYLHNTGMPSKYEEKSELFILTKSDASNRFTAFRDLQRLDPTYQDLVIEDPFEEEKEKLSYEQFLLFREILNQIEI